MDKIADGIGDGEFRGIDKGKVLGIEKGRASGFAEGRAIGITEGKAAALLRLARLKFETIPDAHVAQVHAADQDQLDAWLDALISAGNLDAVFGAPG